MLNKIIEENHRIKQRAHVSDEERNSLIEKALSLDVTLLAKELHNNEKSNHDNHPISSFITTNNSLPTSLHLTLVASHHV
jgi:uridine kinase